ncbi:MAG: dihydropteroate synthase [Verrucomicrobiae bacterium]|nr:dihydropteroate synthase [Verrucomicrobiae bacterium]
MLAIEHLAWLATKYSAALECKVAGFKLGGRTFDFNTRPAIMGVINLSPDSWYRESVCLTAAQAIRRARVLTAQGADIVDVGAESSLAHATRADEHLQKQRLVPVVRSLSNEGILVSIETYNVEVARACLEAGARVINITGTEHVDDLFRLIAEHDAAAIICHVQGRNVREVGDFDFGRDVLEQMLEYFSRQVDRAVKAGVTRIILDPGLGFYYRNLQDSAFRVRYQITVFVNTFRLRRLGWPICHALPHAFEYFGEEVRCAEPFFAVLAALGKTDVFRTHEVPRIKAVLDTLAVYDPDKEPTHSP